MTEIEEEGYGVSEGEKTGEPQTRPLPAPPPVQPPGERGGPKGPEPTRFGDWEKGGRCSDF